MSANFYNTTHETGVTRLHCQSVAERQEDAVLRFFKAHPGELFTPSEINHRVLPGAEITSVRRAITDLTPLHLVMTGVLRMGPRGRREHCWKYPVATAGRAVSGGDLLL